MKNSLPRSPRGEAGRQDKPQMKHLKNAKSYLLVLLLLNVSVFAIIIILFFKTNQIRVLNINNSKADYLLPSLSSKIADLNIGSRAFIVYDTESRLVVFGKNEKLRFAPASTAKIMTAAIVIENYDLDKILTVTNLNEIKGSKMNLVEGERITIRNLLYGMMLPSGNDAARVLAENYPGGIDNFVAAMNKKTKKIGLENTKFFDPAGYDDANYTTAFDLARLASYAIKNKEFAKIVATREIEVTDTTGKIVHNLRNLNELLEMKGVNGIKTGFTDEAGGVLVTSIVQDTRNYIIVVLNSQDRFSDTKNVIYEGLQKIRLLFY